MCACEMSVRVVSLRHGLLHQSSMTISSYLSCVVIDVADPELWLIGSTSSSSREWIASGRVTGLVLSP